MEILSLPIIAFAYFFLAVIVAVVGSEKEIGWITSLILSVLFSPVVGMFAVLASKNHKTAQFEKVIMDYIENISSAKQEKEMSMQQASAIKILDEQLDTERITVSEYKRQKDVILLK